MLFFTQYNLTPKNYSENLMLSLDMLYKEVSDGRLGFQNHFQNFKILKQISCHLPPSLSKVPRVMVNVVEVLEMDPLRRVTKDALVCTLMQRFV